MISYPVGPFLHKATGATERFLLEAPCVFKGADAPKLASNITGKVRLIKLSHEINVELRDIHTSVEAVCVRCLKTFIAPISIASAERQFIIDLPDDEIEVGEEVFYVNPSTNLIDLTEMLRQEIILHFSDFPLCSGCYG